MMSVINSKTGKTLSCVIAFMVASGAQAQVIAPRYTFETPVVEAAVEEAPPVVVEAAPAPKPVWDNAPEAKLVAMIEPDAKPKPPAVKTVKRAGTKVARAHVTVSAKAAPVAPVAPVAKAAPVTAPADTHIATSNTADPVALAAQSPSAGPAPATAPAPAPATAAAQ